MFAKAVLRLDIPKILLGAFQILKLHRGLSQNQKMYLPRYVRLTA